MSDEVDPRIEMEVTVSFRYKTDPGNYEIAIQPGENLGKVIAEIDAEQFDSDPGVFYEMMEAEEGAWTINVKPVSPEEVIEVNL